ncbi:MAG: biotin/lipoyl-binding protein [Clostridia bacterium]|nr:biotin/lipoyl-binding protein [Clostridia bacterium]
MRKTVKKTLLILIIVLVIIGLLCGGLLLLRNLRRKPVNVFAVSDFAMTDDYSAMSETYGSVETDNLQKILLTETQTVTEIFVKEGQEVKAGDKLLAFDTTLTDLDISRAEINVKRLELQQTTAQNELSRLRNLTPHRSVLVTPDPDSVVYTPQETPKKLGGSGTESDPYYYLWGAGDSVDSALLAELFPAAETEETPSQAVYLVLIEREDNALNAPITDSRGIRLEQDESGVSFGFFTPYIPENIQQYEEKPAPYYQESGSDYTAAELSRMRAEKEQELRELAVSVKIAQLELDKLKKETADGVVYSTVSGTVKAVRDPVEAYNESKPVVEVSAGGGYYITGTMSELELDSVKVGQTVQLVSYSEYGMETGCEGTIVEISQYPAANADHYSYDSNNNVSYYPFKVFVADDADLREGDFVSISYQSSAEAGAPLFLENAFIRTENGSSYVYVRGEDGLLEQRTVRLGKDLWGWSTQIKSGLSEDDYIAFPYGTDVVEGAKTVEAEPDALYAGAWF